MKNHRPGSRIFIVTGLSFFYFFARVDLYAQFPSTTSSAERGELIKFAQQRNKEWNRDFKKAINLSEELHFPVSYVDERGRIVMLQRLGFHNRPVYYVTDNLDAANIISAKQLWTGEDEQPWLSGEGMEVNLWDGGAIFGTHQEFQNSDEPRILMREQDIAVSNHATHVAGTIGAAGIDEQAHGMAARVTIEGWDYNNDVAEMAFLASEGMQLSNHSYGSLCGWDYNSILAHWCWYGDTLISADEDYQFGFYDQVSEELDFIAWSAPEYLIVKSAGNDRLEAPPDQPIEHYIWDNGWNSATVERAPDGGTDGYDCLTPMSVAKNILTVGAVDDDRLITGFSASGPTDDGRIKPDVVAGGMDVYSSIGTSTSSYATYSGTSMAAASVTGSIALLQQLQQQFQPGVELLSSTLKGILIHTADEMGSGPGPDYQHGWGLLNIKEAADIIQLNAGSGGYLIREETISEGESLVISIETKVSVSDLKVTLCWTDPPGTPTDPLLNSREPNLVNDLDLKIIESQSQQIYLPWKLDPDTPGAPAVQEENHVDNVEQVLIPDAIPGTYQVKIDHSGTLEGETQHFSLMISGIAAPSDIFPPHHLQYSAGESSIELFWDSPDEGSPDRFRIYRNGLPLALSYDTSYIDNDVDTDIAYTYYVTCCYDVNATEYESLGSNKITAIPRSFRTLPHIIDFEGGYDEMLIKNTPDGWLWGDSDSLSCYYLRFEENTSSFIAANSYTYGRVINVKDIAATMPLKLAGHTGVSISFDYLFLTEMYGAIDEMHLMYRLPGESNWKELEELPRTAGWTTYSVPFPDEICVDGTQIGFYYDDMYLWGFGAGLDNIMITGSETRTVDFGLVSMTSPVSDCFLSESETVIISIKNEGDTDALPGDVITLRMNISTGTELEEQIVLDNALHPGEILFFQWPVSIDLSEPGSYDFDFLLQSELDFNTINNTFNTTINVSGPVVVTILNQDHVFCEGGPPELIQVYPPGGLLTGTGITGQSFDPSTAGVGTHLITYTCTDPAGCTGTTSAELEVIPLPEPSILNQDLSFCEDDIPVEIEVSPAGGELTGTGITGQSFDPSTAGVGTHVITYTVTDDAGCEGSVSAEVVVNPVPEPIIVIQSRKFCRNDLPVQIEVSPAGGELTGPGVTDLIFDPGLAGTGISTCTYTYIDASGCSGSDEISLQVFENPWIDLGPDQELGLDDTIELEPSGNGASFLWFNGSTESTLVIYTNEIGTGEHTIWVETINTESCTAADSMLLTVTSAPSGANGHQSGIYCVYPNPFRDGFFLEINPGERVEDLTLIGATGQIYLNEVPATFPYIGVPELPAGYYILTIRTAFQHYTFGIIKL